MSCACSTLFFNTSAEELISQYEAMAEPANGYLTKLDNSYVLVDATATETADWSRQSELASAISSEDTTALSIFIVGDLWALALSRDGQPATIAAFTPDEAKTLELLPHMLLEIEGQLADLFPDTVETDRLDEILGAMVEGAVRPEDGIADILDMIGAPPDWMRWSWFEIIPEQLFLDPDLSKKVTPLGEARTLWED